MVSVLSYSMIHRLAILLLVAGAVVGCESTGGPNSSRADTLAVVPGLAGIVQSNGATSSISNVFAGDVDEDVPGLNTRGFLTFDLSTIPAGKTVRTANLKLVQFDVQGSPYTDLGDLVVDHLLFGNSLDAADFSFPPLVSAFAVLSQDPAPGVRLVNVLQRVRADIEAGRTMSQFRLRFSTQDGDNDNLQDFAMFNDSEENPPPIIILTYNE
jgi:hypothetical protein